MIFWIGLASVSMPSFSVGVTSQASDSNVIFGRSGTNKFVHFNSFSNFSNSHFVVKILTPMVFLRFNKFMLGVQMQIYFRCVL